MSSDGPVSPNPARDAIADSPMHIRQFIIVGLCCVLNMADGYDVLSLALAAPQLSRELNVAPQVMGLAFAANSVGLVFGAFFVAPLADRFGRRAIVLVAVAMITCIHWLLAVSPNIWAILILRGVMGVSLGTLVVSLNVIVSEYSNERWRSLLIAFLHTGFSLGMALSGLVAAEVLDPLGWRYIFVAGGVINLVVLVLSVIFLLESPEYLLGQQPRNALARVNAIMAKLHRKPLEALPPKAKKENDKPKFTLLMTKELRTQTLLMWVASFAYTLVGFFLMNWKPQVLVDAGLTPTMASYVGVFNGVFGTVGHISIGLLARRFNEAKLTATYFALLTVALIFFGAAPAEPLLLLFTAGIMTMFTVGAYTGIFLVAIKFYSVEARNTGVGFIVGWGRVGAIIGPMLGGVLVGAGLARSSIFIIFAAISVVPAIAMYLVGGGRLARTRTDETEEAQI